MMGSSNGGLSWHCQEWYPLRHLQTPPSPSTTSFRKWGSLWGRGFLWVELSDATCCVRLKMLVDLSEAACVKHRTNLRLRFVILPRHSWKTGEVVLT